MFSRFERFLIAVMFALLAAGIALVFAHAQGATPTPPPANNVNGNNCVACHQDIFNTWQTGPHGRAMTDPVFSAAWNAQGKPGACLVCHSTGYDPATGKSDGGGVACVACHNPIPPNHPKDKMPIDRTTQLCGNCHSDPRFATGAWKMSAHYQSAMSCTVCHDAHTAGMKSIAGAPAANGDASALCENCHKNAMANFPASKHAAAGVTCVNCHLGFNVAGASATNADFITAHKAPDHSFIPSLDTCKKCHANQMHAPGQAVSALTITTATSGGTPTPIPPMAATSTPLVSNQPAPVSPLGFVSMAGLIGLAGGMVLAPWLERAMRRFIKGGRNG